MDFPTPKTYRFISNLSNLLHHSIEETGFPRKSDPSLSLPECSKLSLNRKWFSNNWKKKKKKTLFLEIQEKGLKIFSESDFQIWILRKGYVEQQQDFSGKGVKHVQVRDFFVLSYDLD